MQNRYQSLTLALESADSSRPVLRKSSTPRRRGGELSKEAQDLLKPHTANGCKGSSHPRKDSKRSSPRKSLKVPSINNINANGTHANATQGSATASHNNEKSYQMKRDELKRYLEKLAIKLSSGSSDKDQAIEKTSNAHKARKEKTETESEKKCIDKLFEHVRNQHITPNTDAKFTRRETHSLPHISEIPNKNTLSLTMSNLKKSNTELNRQMIRSQPNQENLPQRLTSYGLASLQEKVYNIDTSYRHAPFCYYSSSYGHPYVTDELYERIVEWIKVVNISVDWRAVQQDAATVSDLHSAQSQRTL